MNGGTPRLGNDFGIVCILHGGFPVPGWLAEASRLAAIYVTINDPGDHDYPAMDFPAAVTRNAAPRGFAENVNAALDKVFGRDGGQLACVVNFDLELSCRSLIALVSALDAQPALAALGANLCDRHGGPTFSVGTWPTPAKEFLRAAGLRSGALHRVQRSVLRRRAGWVARNACPTGGGRTLGSGEYLPWTCVAIRRPAWRDIGPLDERFPLYGEDIDWSLRVKRSGWRLGIHDCGPVVHDERATRGPRADALYEYSHLELHRKWGWQANLRWQGRGLHVRRRWPARALTEPLDWPRLTNLDESARR